jgi:hypothetical protein
MVFICASIFVYLTTKVAEQYVVRSWTTIVSNYHKVSKD